MKIISKGFILILIAVIIIISLFIFLNTNNNDLARNYCLINGYNYELRLINDVPTGFCVFNNSECLANAFLNHSCKPGDKLLMNCSNYEEVKYCSQELNPVCAKIIIGVNNQVIIAETWGNACSACFNSKFGREVVSYTNGSC